ncbi:MAG: DUF5679 domain-containing protein [Ignavibacterium sp.]|nr:DUF5679 domain-containing protein [Ignavibacterium sp.]
MTQAFCMRCKKKVEAVDERMIELDTKKGKKKAIKGKCPICGTTVFKIVGK